MSNWSIEYEASVAILGFSRPPENLMDFASMIELSDRLEELATRRDQVKIILLWGGVDGVFINHGELSDLARAGAGVVTPQELDSWPRALRLLEEVPQPTVAAIDGLASGGGNEIALACTLRIGSQRAQLQQPEVTVGIIPGGGGSVRLPRLVGPGVAADALLTGRIFDAQEALRAGWISAVLPTDGFKQNVLAWAAAISSSPGESLNAAKKSIVMGARLAFADAMKLEGSLYRQLSASSPSLWAQSADV